jgi:hypothetical protein
LNTSSRSISDFRILPIRCLASGFALFFFFYSVYLFADGTGPSLSVSPNGSFILLEGTDLNGVKHVLHSEPSLGIGAELSFQRMLGDWSPKFDISTHQIKFYGANDETVQYSSGYYTSYSVGIEKILLNSWVASGFVGYSDQLFLSSPSTNVISVDKVRAPEATLQSSAGVFNYKSYVFVVGAKAIAYFPVSTADYSAKLGYGIEPSVSTTHIFSKHISGSGEFFYQKRIQNSSVFDLTEQDFGIALTILFN